ncbi:MAG: zinc-ribbon domain-containing protein, partial [Promethearchaeota archaeon]
MFCPKCGSKVSNDTEYCTNCGENLEKAINLLKETPVISKKPMSKSDIELSLDGNVETLFVQPNVRKKFNIVVWNHRNNPLRDVKLELSGPPQVELIVFSKMIRFIGSLSVKKTYFTILPEVSGHFILTVKLHSKSGDTLTYLIKLQVKSPKSIEKQESSLASQQETPLDPKQEIPTSMPSPWSKPKSSDGINQALVMFVIVAIIGLILMISGIITFF